MISANCITQIFPEIMTGRQFKQTIPIECTRKKRVAYVHRTKKEKQEIIDAITANGGRKGRKIAERFGMTTAALSSLYYKHKEKL
jgi:hypothetical protein